MKNYWFTSSLCLLFAFLLPASASANPAPDPCPCSGNYVEIQVYYFGPDNVAVQAFSNPELSTSIISFANVLNGELLTINGAGLAGGALTPNTYLRVTAGADVTVTKIYSRCPSEAYPGALEDLAILGKTFGPFIVYATTDQGNNHQCTVANVEQDWRLGGNIVGSENNTLGTRNNESLRLITSNQNRGIITAAGNFGIGNIAPASRLDVSGKGFFRNNADALGLVGTDNVYLEYFPNGAATRRGRVGFLEASTRSFTVENTFPAGDLLLNTNGNIQLNSNRVGVGIDAPNPATKLHVVGNRIRLSTSLANLDRFLDLRTDGAGIDVNSVGDDLFIRSSDNNNVLLNTQPGDGNVGIGTTTPQQKLHVEGNRIMLSTIGNAARNMELRTDGAGIDINTTGDDLFIRSQGGNNVYINSQSGDGRVGIGTTNLATGYLLTVDGRIACEEMLIDDSGFWPDYVFENDYKLLTLDELDAAIRQNKHLPGVPPAKEVENAGIEIGDMQKRTMEKIEELHLYILQLHKRLSAVEAENAQLKSTQK